MAKKDKEAKAPKAAKAPKETKPGSGGANFFQLHVEKLVLGAIALVMGYLVYDGLGTQGIPENKTPDNLTKTASSALDSVRQDHWNEIMVQPDRQYKAEFSGLARNSRTPTVDKPYETDPWEIAPRSVSEKRGDPAMLAPINLQVVTGYGALAVNVKADSPDPFADFDDADEIKSKKRPPRTTGRTGGRAAGGSGGSGGMMLGGGDDQMDMGSGGGSDMGAMGPMGGMGLGAGAPGRRLNPQYDRGFGSSSPQMGGMGMGSMGMMGSDGGDMGDIGAPSGGSGGAIGGRGSMGIGNPMGSGGATTKAGQKLGYKSVYFNVVSGLAPHKELVEEYKKAFEDSAGFNLMRDRPRYLSFIAERVDVTADPSKDPAEGDWKKVTDLRLQEKMLLNEWAGTNAETANPLFTDPSLTIAPLPLLLKDYRPLVSHPDIPLSGQQLAAPPIDESGEGNKENESDEDDGDMFSSRRRNMQGGGMMPGGMMPGGMMPGGSSGASGMPTPGGMAGGRGGMGSGAMGSGGMMDGGMMDGGDEMGGSGMMNLGGSPFGGSMFGGNSTTLEAESEFKLIRFYDFDIKPGHVYRYRIRLVMEDPNHPEDSMLDPELSILKNEVFTRVVGVRSEDDKKPANKEGVKPRTFYRFSDWSVASSPAYASYPGIFANGAVNISKRTMNVTGADNVNTALEVDSSTRGPVGSIVFADWNSNLGVDVPTEYEAQRGTLLFFNPKDKEPEIVDPITKNVKKLKGYKMNEAIAVIDIRGGETLGHNDDRTDRLALSGEMLVFRNDGNLEICDELDDQDNFRMFTFADEKEQADKAASAPAGGGMGLGGPMGGEGDGGGSIGGREGPR